MREIIYLKEKAKIDGGIFFGKGVFETILIKDKPIFLNEHIKRLNEAIEKLAIGEAINSNNVEQFIKENNIKNTVLKILITEKNIIYTTRKNKYTKEDYKNGFRLKFSEVLRNPTSMLTYIKSINYLENLIEYEKAQNKGYNEAIFLNIEGNVAEGCTTNIFLVKNNKLITPKVSSGILPGVVRQWVIDNYSCEEKYITKDELLHADEVFLTNSVVGIIKVSSIEEIQFKDNVTEDIRKVYNNIVLGGK